MASVAGTLYSPPPPSPGRGRSNSAVPASQLTANIALIYFSNRRFRSLVRLRGIAKGKDGKGKLHRRFSTERTHLALAPSIQLGCQPTERRHRRYGLNYAVVLFVGKIVIVSLLLCECEWSGPGEARRGARRGGVGLRPGPGPLHALLSPHPSPLPSLTLPSELWPLPPPDSSRPGREREKPSALASTCLRQARGLKRSAEGSGELASVPSVGLRAPS